MPVTLDPNEKQPGGSDQGKGSTTPGQLRRASGEFDYEEDYPKDLDLRPGYELHETLVDEVLERARESWRFMNERHSEWRDIDKNLKAHVYQPTGGHRPEVNIDGGSQEEDDMRDRVIMPVSYAMLETILTFMTTAFLKDPVFTYEGTGPEDVVGAELLTRVVEKHVRQNAVGLKLHTAWRDMFAYGIGVASPVWEREYGKETVLQDVGFLDRVANVFNVTGQQRAESEYRVVQEGNDLINVDPYRYLPDPNVSAHEVQDGEWVGWLDRTNLKNLMRDEAGRGSDFFNVGYLDELEIDGESMLQNMMSGRDDDDDAQYTHKNNPVDIIWMYVDIIPRRWNLGESSNPEKWVFALAGDEVIVQAHPVGLTHEKFPVAVGAPDFDGYSVAPPSKMATVAEMQHIIDFLYTSHLENIKKAINNNFVVDPSLVNIHDVNDNKPGKLIRMRKKAWGKGGIDEAIQQLEVQDFTQQNVQEAQLLQQFAQQATGANDSILGNLPERSSRISAREIQGVRSSALSRMERPARIQSMQFMLPIARQFAENTQQLMEREDFVKLTGTAKERLKKRYGMDREVRNDRAEVSPLDLVVQYETIPHDTTFPGQESGQLWTELFSIIGQSQELQQEIDVVRVFQHIAKQLGAKNVENFMRKRPMVRPDDEVQEAARRGDAVPLEDVQAQASGGAGNGRASPATAL